MLLGGQRKPVACYGGIGYDGVAAEPLASVIAFDTRRDSWRVLPDAPTATMDHRGLPILGDTAWIAGGMRAGQSVSAGVERWMLHSCPH